jgi:hypothetical protein
MGDTRTTYIFLDDLKGRYYLEDLVDGRIILKRILKKVCGHQLD